MRSIVKQQQLFNSEPLPWVEAARDDMVCAQIVFNRPLESTFDYLVPDALRDAIRPGQRVKAPFGKGDTVTVGYCVGVGQPRRFERLKFLHSVVDRQPLLSPHMLQLTQWIAERYLCAWGQVLDSVVPAGVKRQAGTREVVMLRLPLEATAAAPGGKLSAKQQAVIDVLEKAGAPVSLEEVARLAQCGTAPITALRRKRMVVAFAERRKPEAPQSGPIGQAPRLKLNVDQQLALKSILTSLREQVYKTFLLHGVTGSGKTEVYIQAIEEVVSYGRQAIVLVPEISLTPQTIRRFSNRFASVAVLHSHLSDVERHRHWQNIASGAVQVVVGARSAVFAPTPHLGLIVIDEEHETSFKQDTVPRYHAREVARHRAELEQVPLILGTATPTLETWRTAQTGQAGLIRLPKRVEGLPMPPVIVVDVRNDPLIGAGAGIGRALRTAMHGALESGGQVILFLNLRGYSPVLWCRACGSGVKCPDCDVTLTWHKETGRALCHSCDHSMPPPVTCPHCQRPGLRYLGLGTQRLEQEVRAKFPQHACLRMDSDSMRRPGSHDVALEAFRKGDVRILLGTQMISKGLDFPNVTLVGVIDADTALHQPDFRATERTFQLIAQVAGRTGRSRKGGRVLVQTSCPTEPAILFAAKHDYVGFAQAELKHRLEMQLPPFAALARVIIRGPNEPEVRSEAARLAESVRLNIRELQLPVRMMGPAPAPVAKLQKNYRYHLQLSSPNVVDLGRAWRTSADRFKPSSRVEFSIDVDPMNLR